MVTQFGSLALHRAEGVIVGSTRLDATEVTKVVRRYAQTIGCDASNTQAAIAWALRSSAHTLQAIRDGHRRAEQLRARQASAHA